MPSPFPSRALQVLPHLNFSDLCPFLPFLFFLRLLIALALFDCIEENDKPSSSTSSYVPQQASTVQVPRIKLHPKSLGNTKAGGVRTGVSEEVPLKLGREG